MFFLIDKPVGKSSFDVIRFLRKKTGIKKMGHIGTLDPLASGLMLVAVGNMTRLIPFLEGGDKTYRFTVNVSGTTASLDLGTPLTSTFWDPHTRIDIAGWTEELLDVTTQIPPLYSAIHVDGTRAYTLARNGSNITLPIRNIRVIRAHIDDCQPPLITLTLTLSSGGYVRSFAPIIARWFGSNGGYISNLRRETIDLPTGATLDVHDAQSLDEDFSIDRTIGLEALFPDYHHMNDTNSEIFAKIPPKIFLKIHSGAQLSHEEIGIFPQGKIFVKYNENLSLIEKIDDTIQILRNNL